MLSKIKNALKKKKEEVIVDLYIKDFDKSNFYFALLFNHRINKYKVLFVPIDAYNKNEDIKDYFCYQFILDFYVETIIKRIIESEELIKKESKKTPIATINDSYYLEMNFLVNNNNYKLIFKQFINEELTFLFDIIVTFFEHSPHIVNELCNKLLFAYYNKNEAFYYNASYDCNMSKYKELFSKEIKNNNQYSLADVKFLEPHGNRYYGVVKNNLIIIDYNSKDIINISCGKLDPLGSEVYTMFEAIEEGLFNDFYHLLVVEEDFNKSSLGQFYYCYGIEEDEFRIIDATKKVTIPLSLLKRKCIKIEGVDKKLKKELEEYLTASYEDFKVDELINFAVSK